MKWYTVSCVCVCVFLKEIAKSLLKCIDIDCGQDLFLLGTVKGSLGILRGYLFLSTSELLYSYILDLIPNIKTMNVPSFQAALNFTYTIRRDAIVSTSEFFYFVSLYIYKFIFADKDSRLLNDMEKWMFYKLQNKK